MPRANRYIQAGCLYHLTHRCHNREFLFRFARVRNYYRELLRKASERFRVPLLNYCITSNHVHLMAEAPTTTAISRMMHTVEGHIASWYNRRKKRSGAFWEDRYHCTMIEDGAHAIGCIQYIDLNMVRAGAVAHPSEWTWCGYNEIVGQRRNYRLVDLGSVAECFGGIQPTQLSAEYQPLIEASLAGLRSARNPIWTESIAVGGRAFVERVSGALSHRRRLGREEVQAGTWVLRESAAPYGPFLGGKNCV